MKPLAKQIFLAVIILGLSMALLSIRVTAMQNSDDKRYAKGKVFAKAWKTKKKSALKKGKDIYFTGFVNDYKNYLTRKNS